MSSVTSADSDPSVGNARPDSSRAAPQDDVRSYAASSTAQPGQRRTTRPRHLPAPPPRFVNRRSQLAALAETVDRQVRPRMPSLTVLRGPRGAGKSALALHWSHIVADRYPDGNLYVELADAHEQPLAVADTLGSILRALGVAPGDVPDRLHERANLYRSITADLALTMLLEDAVSAQQVISLLPASSRSAVVVTTHRTLSGLVAYQPCIVPVDPLDHAAAREMVQAFVGGARLTHDEQATTAVLDSCGGLPIALMAAAAVLSDHPQRTVTDLADQLATRTAIDALSPEDDTVSVRATFDLVYGGLTAGAQRAYLAIGVQPGLLITPELVSATSNVSFGDTCAAVDELARACLLDEIRPGHHRCHTLIHAHAHDLAHRTIDPSELAAMNLATLEYLLCATRQACATVLPARARRTYPFETRPIAPPGLDDPTRALAWLDEHKHTIVEAIQQANNLGYWQLAYLLARDVQPLFIVHKDHDLNFLVCQLGLGAARKANDTTGQVDMQARQVGNLLCRGDIPEADRLAQHLVTETTTRGDHPGLAKALNALGGVHLERDDLAAAEDTYRQAVDISGELDDNYSQALSRISLGAVLTNQGRAGEARAVLADALAQFQHLPAHDPYNTARAAIELARAHRILGELDQAQHLLTTTEPTLLPYGSTFAVLSSLRDELTHVQAALYEQQLPDNPDSRTDQQ